MDTGDKRLTGSLSSSKNDILDKTDSYLYDSDEGTSSELDDTKMSVLSKEFFGKEDKVEMEQKIKELQAQINAVGQNTHVSYPNHWNYIISK